MLINPNYQWEMILIISGVGIVTGFLFVFHDTIEGIEISQKGIKAWRKIQKNDNNKISIKNFKKLQM